MNSRQLLTRLLREEYFVLARGHHHEMNRPNNRAAALTKDLNAEDSLLVLSACDVLVTDYSSLVVDAAFLDIPTVLLTPDIDNYELSPGLTIPLRQLAAGILTACVASAAEQVVEQTAKGFPVELRKLMLAIGGLPTDPLSPLPSPFDQNDDLRAILG
jgi:CDP-glycerol glycerophosphotransferase (TagB/SpsB family)